jgi:4-hydroxy-3-methylbut-2-enyl diphosphate reductase
VVHNKTVVDDLSQRGAVFVEELHEVPDDAIVIFSAHGVSKAIQDEASDRGLKVFDATCPLVTKVHVEVTAFSRAGRECILIGHEGHPEVEGTMGQYDTSKGGKMYLVEDEEQVAHLAVLDPDNLAFVTQTTLSVDDTAKVIEALRARFPNIQGPRKDDICYATQNRQDAVRTLAEKSNVVLVVGSPNSSNSNRLKELAERCGASAYLIESADMIDPKWMSADDKIGVTAGASAPEHLVEGVVSWLRGRGHEGVESLEGRPENITFSLPKELRIPMVDLS